MAPALLEQLTCAPGPGELGRILTTPQAHQASLQNYQAAICSGQATARAQRFAELATELRNQLDTAKIAQQVRPHLPSGGALVPRGAPGPRLGQGQVCPWPSRPPADTSFLSLTPSPSAGAV